MLLRSITASHSLFLAPPLRSACLLTTAQRDENKKCNVRDARVAQNKKRERGESTRNLKPKKAELPCMCLYE